MQFYETDAMGIIHHANYVFLMEEARLHFLRALYGQIDGNYLAELNYPLVSCHVDYKSPLHFNEDVKIDYTVSTEGARLIFDYLLWTKSIDKPCAFGKTVHAAFDMKSRKPVKLPGELLEFLENQGK